MGFEEGKVYRLTDGRSTFTIGVAAAPETRRKGLSGRPFMARGHGLLFVFEEAAPQTMWMVDMRFPLDIVWMDGDMRITKIERGAEPCIIANSACQRFPSGSPVKFAIELNAGDAAALGLAVGSTLREA